MANKLSINTSPAHKRLFLRDLPAKTFARVVDPMETPGIVFKASSRDDKCILFRLDGHYDMFDSYGTHQNVEIELLTPGESFTVTV